MAFRVVDVPSDGARNAFLAVGVGGYVRLSGEQYDIGRKYGLLTNVEHVSAREYDVLADLALRLGGN